MPVTTLKVLTIVGTRPELIRLSRIIVALDQSCHHVLVHTGQNYDPQLSSVFFDELELRNPDYYLDAGKGSLGAFLGSLFTSIERILLDERPDAVLVLGDTNSALAAFVAKRLGIVVFHMEAGNRSFDSNVPEETNRRVVDHFADINLVYTEHARRNLLAEGLHPRNIYLTGSPLSEVIGHYRGRIDRSNVLAELDLRPNEYYLLSLHREENIDDEQRLVQLLTNISAFSDDVGLPMVVSAHPRLQHRLADGRFNLSERFIIHSPFGFFDYAALQSHARCVISDSGTISEEAAILGFPAVTMRDAIERPEAMDAGSIVLAGSSSESLRNAVSLIEHNHSRRDPSHVPVEYLIANCSERVVNLIVGITPVGHVWSGLRRRRLP